MQSLMLCWHYTSFTILYCSPWYGCRNDLFFEKLFTLCYVSLKSLSAHQHASLSMSSTSMRCWSDAVLISVTMFESSNTSEITLAKYRSTTASSSKLMSSLFHPITKHSQIKPFKTCCTSRHLNWTGLKETQLTISLQGHAILLALWRTM